MVFFSSGSVTSVKYVTYVKYVKYVKCGKCGKCVKYLISFTFANPVTSFTCVIFVTVVASFTFSLIAIISGGIAVI